ncbi:hypothetical protein, partial [Burkholderia thailandensis]|uniref:hypothetical protein n=1 Tax=Burkholderia thailandensis TaxID=57975 RepID=UPI001CA4C9F0
MRSTAARAWAAWAARHASRLRCRIVAEGRHRYECDGDSRDSGGVSSNHCGSRLHKIIEGGKAGSRDSARAHARCAEEARHRPATRPSASIRPSAHWLS